MELKAWCTVANWAWWVLASIAIFFFASIFSFWASSCCHTIQFCAGFLFYKGMCFFTFIAGSYFCYDNPSALQNQIKDVSMTFCYKYFQQVALLNRWCNLLIKSCEEKLACKMYFINICGHDQRERWCRYCPNINNWQRKSSNSFVLHCFQHCIKLLISAIKACSVLYQRGSLTWLSIRS